MRSKAAVPMLVDLFWYGFDKEEQTYARLRAQEALEKIGKPAVLPLIDLLGYAHGDQLSVLFSMLGKIGDRRAVAPIRKCKCEICTPEYDSQKDALKALGENVVTFDDVSR
jgi:HEAT repeat protein